jgi:hypothetical protein
MGEMFSPMSERDNEKTDLQSIALAFFTEAFFKANQ